jgi:hypothetical protein
MTADAELPEDGPDDGTAEAGPAGDWMLELFVEGLESHPDSSMDITLYVGGIVVSGRLVSGATWFEQAAVRIRSISTGDGVEGMASAFDEAAAQLRAESSVAGSDFVHVIGAQVLAPGAASELPSGFWRGQLSRVDAWSVGRMSRTPS